jgi:hypothetical protein
MQPSPKEIAVFLPPPTVGLFTDRDPLVRLGGRLPMISSGLCHCSAPAVPFSCFYRVMTLRDITDRVDVAA